MGTELLSVVRGGSRRSAWMSRDGGYVEGGEVEDQPLDLRRILDVLRRRSRRASPANLEIEYVDLLLDFQIPLATIPAMLSARGAR